MTSFMVKLAPFSISWERILQTLAAIWLIFLQLISPIATPILAFYLIFFTNYWWLCLIYIVWYWFFDNETLETSGRRSEWMRNWEIWNSLRDYFPMKMIKTTDLDPRRNYLFCYFPHGILSVSSFLTTATNAGGFRDLFPNHISYLHTIPLFYKLPFVREIALLQGGRSASKKSLNNILSKPEGGNVSALVVGGASEAYYCKPGAHKILLKKRKGFIKIALQNGAPLVPVYCFGENELFLQYDLREHSFFQKCQDLFKRLFGFSLILFRGRGIFEYSFGILPFRKLVTVVVGEPINVEKNENPTKDEIEEVHEKFEKKLIDLFEENKKYYLTDHENAFLEIT